MIFLNSYRIVHAAKNAYITHIRRHLISAAPVTQSMVDLCSTTLTRTIRGKGS